MKTFTTAIGKLNAIAAAELGSVPTVRRKHSPQSAEVAAFKAKVQWVKRFIIANGGTISQACAAWERDGKGTVTP